MQPKILMRQGTGATNPGECMKARVQHLVPLSRQALELLLRVRTISGDTVCDGGHHRNGSRERLTKCVAAYL